MNYSLQTSAEVVILSLRDYLVLGYYYQVTNRGPPNYLQYSTSTLLFSGWGKPRTDLRCGPRYKADCDGSSLYPCCNTDMEICGRSKKYCNCDNCKDFRSKFEFDTSLRSYNSIIGKPNLSNSSATTSKTRPKSHFKCVILQQAHWLQGGSYDLQFPISVTNILTISVFRPSEKDISVLFTIFVSKSANVCYISDFRYENRAISDFRHIRNPPPYKG